MTRTRVKFCGLTRPGDVRLACEFGVDAVGFVLVPGSPRAVAPSALPGLRAAVSPLVQVVALFMDPHGSQVLDAMRRLRPTLLQFHGNEDDAFCRGFGVPWIKAVAMGDGQVSATALQLRYPGAAGFLFDSHVVGGSGGTGRTFDWSHLPKTLNRPVILAGGLTPDNVFDAILSTLPWGVDISSGIEVEPGVKDGERMRHFVEEVRRADCHVEHEPAAIP